MEPIKLHISLQEKDRLNLSLQDRDRLGIFASNAIHYSSLIGKPSINGVVLIGNKTSSDLGIELPVHQNTTATWNAERDLIGQNNHIYVYTDYIVRDEQNYPGIKIGDGATYLVDLPFVNAGNEEMWEHIHDTEVHITNEEREFWNNKVTSYLSSYNPEELILTKN